MIAIRGTCMASVGRPPYHTDSTRSTAMDLDQQLKPATARKVFLRQMTLPAELLRAERQPVLTEALFAASRHKKVQLHFNKGIAGASAEAVRATRETATNPAVLDAFVLVIIADGGPPAYPGMPGRVIDKSAAQKDAGRIAAAAAELRKLVPDAGSYVSESNYFNPRWQAAYWGGNYRRLRAVKAKYDPDELFFGHNGVGSEGWSTDGFIRT
jgi:FAD/FMN-containing dehydrogenase